MRKGQQHPPMLTAEDKYRLADWLASFPMMGVYVAVDGELVSQNAGAEAKGGRDIQEKMPPEGKAFTPSGEYWYINDRNAAVRYDMPVDRSFHTEEKLNVMSLTAAPFMRCKDKEQGRVVISGNSVLSVYDSEQGRLDFCVSTGCRLDRKEAEHASV